MKHRTHNRILSFFLALVMLCTNAPFPVNSVENGEENAVKQPSGSSQLVYDYDTLKITKDGTQISSLSLQSHEKIEVSADGISANAEYQWQVQHPENDDVWVNVYDGTNQTISVTAALVGNVLREDGTAKLRCRAYTDDYAYLTNTLTVTLCSEIQNVVTVTGENKTLLAAADGDADAETPEFVTITIEYLRYDYVKNSEGEYVLDKENPTQAFSPYIATIPYNANFNAIVPVPTIVGYEARLGDDDTAIKTVTLDYTNLTGNRTIRVKYLPAEVNYTVRYYFQNIYDDGYVEDTSQQKNSRGYTGSAPKDSDVKQDFTGFTSMFYQPDTIAADGSTVFEVYYERNYYLMDFDCDGGYGADPVYVRYGTYISIPTPKKSGWVFDWWDMINSEDPKDDQSTWNDEKEDLLPTTMPAYNSHYKAIWSTADTTFTVAYWIVNDDGSRSYIGSHIAEGKSADVVHGEDYKLGTEATSGTICGQLRHDHGEDCYTCGLTESAHTDACFAGMSLDSNADPLTSGNAAIKAFEHGGEPENGYIYVIYAHHSKTYWPKLYLNGTYYHVNNTQGGSNTDSFNSIIDGDVLGSITGTFNGERLTVTKYTPKTNCSQSHHLHGASCCVYKQHAHTEECYQDTRHLEYQDKVTLTIDGGERTYKTDKNVTVEGDGSTVVNVYYQYKEYTLKFYYAATTGGTETDNDNDPNTYDTIRVVGGSTWNFGTSDVTGPEDPPQLANVGGWGDVDELPTLNTEGEKKGYTKGTLTHNNITYHYISFEARYGDYIADLWPCAVFNSVTRVDANTHGYWDGKEAFVSAWNGEHYVKYSQDNTNETIKGKYEVLDDNLLFDSRVYSGEYDEVSFLCFWENGTDLYWSVPELYRYYIYLEAHKGQDLTGLTTITRDGTTYYLANSYDTCDDSDVRSQTQVALTGYEQKLYTTARDGFKINKFEYKILTGTTDETLLQQDGYFDASLYSQGFDVYFYYTLKEHVLKFMNHNEWLTDGDGSKVKFGTSLKNHGAYVGEAFMAKPENYPETLEPGAYQFAGWYTSPTFLDGTEMDWNSTMPDSDFTVYARWEPVTHNVYFYELYDDVGSEKYWYPKDENGNTIDIVYPIEAKHGDSLGTKYTYIPKRDRYNFVGWFYMDENGKKRFAPDSMEIKQELHLFAEWQSGIDTEYEVNYVYDNDTPDDPTDDIFIAPETEGHSTAGKTKTFNAKGGMELNNGYQTGYFPKTGSHSILMDEDSNKNTYVFEYVYDDSVWYKVQYLDNVTKLPIADAKIESTNHAVVTERFTPVSGYVPMPGYYYQTKSLTADYNAQEPIEANIITFYYMKDDTHGAYSIEYYVEDETGSEEYNGKMYRRHTSFQNTADLKDQDGNPTIINSGVLANGDEFEILDFDGYTYILSLIINYDDKGEAMKPKEVKVEDVKGTLDANGLTIKLYYDKVSYPYEIQFLEYGTGKVLGYGDINDNQLYPAPPEVSAPFGNEIKYTAAETLTIGSTNYEYYIPDATDEQRTDSMKIRAVTEDNPDTTDKDEYNNPNILKFYYTPKQYEVKYKAVCTDKSLSKFGVVSPSSQIVTTVDQLEATATPYYGYRFIGWYTDEACENKVNSDWVNGTVLKPQELKEATYYALFEPITADLTINKSVSAGPAGANHSFIFTIVGKDNNNKHVNLTISINGDGSVTIKDLPIGDYTITELSGWSYLYTADKAEKPVEVSGSSVNEVSFTNTYQGSDWLGDEDSVDNDFGTYTPGT